MDFANYQPRDIWLTAIKAEIDAWKSYRQASKYANDERLVSLLKRLASDEREHAEVLVESLVDESLPGEKIRISGKLPKFTRVPVPDLFPVSMLDLKQGLAKAVAAERAAKLYYAEMIPLAKNLRVRYTLQTIARMEAEHETLLKDELERMNGK